MQEVTVICDKCHKKIEGKIHKFYDGIVSAETGDFIDYCEDTIFSKDLDFCDKCAEEFHNILSTFVDLKPQVESLSTKIKLVKALYNRGVPCKQRPKKLNCSLASVYNYLRKSTQ